MHLPGRRRIVLPAPVVYTVGNVGKLLYLGYHKATTGRVYSPGLDEEKVTLVRSHHIEHILESALGTAVKKLRHIHILVEAHIYPGPRVGLKDVPGLVLAIGVVPVKGSIVVRMHLDRQAVVDIQQLDQYRELIPETLIVVVSDYLVHIGLNDIKQGIAVQPASVYHRAAVLKARYLPALAYQFLRIERFVELGCQTVTAPDPLCRLGHKSQWIYRFLHFYD